MALYFCADGGGTKLLMLAFDEKLRLLGGVRGTGVSTLTADAGQVQENIRATVRSLIDMLPPQLRGSGPLRVEKLYQTSCGAMGPAAVSEKVLDIGETVSIGEGPCGVLAGLAADTGVLTLSGTGSDCFYVQKGQRIDAVGGFGPILGDEGSGYDMGQRTLQAAIRADDGRGPASLLRDYVFEDYGLKQRMWELVDIVHGSDNYRRPVARATYTLARAAKDGDAVAQDILRQAGRILASDTAALLHRAGQGPECTLPVTVSGGSWKIHPLLWQTYARCLREAYPRLQISAPHFEPVMAGVIRCILDTEGTVSPERLAQLKENFAPYVLDQYFTEAD